MRTVTVRDLRNRGGDVLAEVERGESFVVTKDGVAVAELQPLRRRGLSGAQLVERCRKLPPIDFHEFRNDVDEALDQSL